MAQSILGKINYLTEEQYTKAKAEGRINPDEIYMTPDDVDLSDRDTSPIGTIHSYAGSTEPKHWLFCDGRELSRLEYKRLFDVIGITYGEGDGISTFNLPDLRGRIPVGVDSTQEEFTEVGKSGGSKYLQSHSHTVTAEGHTAKMPGYAWGTTGEEFLMGNGGWKSDTPGVAGTGDSENLQPYLVLNYIIKYEGGSVASDAMPEITIGEVETLAPGSQATAEFTGTTLNPTLNLGIPQGPAGEKPSTLDILKAVYPVGSVYIGTNTTNPNTLFGFGTWERLKGGFIYGANEGFSQSEITGTSSGATSGTSGSYSGTSGSYSGTSGSYSGTSGSTTLTADQMPKHRHTLHIGINTPSSLVKGYGLSYTSQTRYPGQFAGDTGGETGGNYMEETGGSKGHTHSIPSHTHSIPSHTHSIPSHTHSMPSHSHNVPYIACVIWRRTA